jgi:hypothetical protein
MKYKSKIPVGSDGKPTKVVEEENFPVAHKPTRAEEMEKRLKEKQFGDYSDIKDMLVKSRATLISNEEYLPKGDLATYSNEELSKMKQTRRSYNSFSNTSYYYY